MSVSLANSLVAVVITSCLTAPAQVATFKLSGEFAQHPDTPYRVSVDYSSTNPTKGPTIAHGKTDARGRFKMDLKLKKGQAFVVTCGPMLYRLWAEPGGDLGLASGEGNVQLTGSLSEPNLFLLNNGLVARTAGQDPDSQEQDLAAFTRRVQVEPRRCFR